MSSLHRFDPRRSLWSSVALVAVVYLITLAQLEHRGFWISDNASKFLQLQAIVASGYTQYSIPWSGAAVDPQFAYNPLPTVFSHVDGDKLYSIYPPLFATVSSIFFLLLGFPGLYVLPLLAALALLAGLGQITARAALDYPAAKNLAVLVAGLCTPLWFYSVVFWEHCLAVCACIWGIFFFLRFAADGRNKDLIYASAATALGVYFRDELYLLCLLLGILAIRTTRKKRLQVAAFSAATTLICLLPLWCFNAWTIGHPLGFHLVNHAASSGGIIAHFIDRPTVLYHLFLSSTHLNWLSLLVSGPFLVAFILNRRFAADGFQRAVPLFALVALLCSLVALSGYLSELSPIDYMLYSSNSLFTTAPFVLLAFLRHDDQTPALKNIWIIALAYAVLYGLAAPRAGSLGIHWGNRYLLILYPLCAALAAANLAHWWNHRVGKASASLPALAAVLLLSCAAQVYSIMLLKSKKDFSVRLNQTIQQRPETAVVSNIRWAPQAMYSAFYDKSMFFVESPEHLNRLARTLAGRGYDRFLFVAQSDQDYAMPQAVQVRDELEFFSLQFVPMGH